ncbi:hypothetical protein CDAR_525481 [Caerostris darwini]|uniref:Uncharacterized protein n=1 Tax=Caerostris darwini TaxID=1538125 RepID=A0AAV4RM80_9ARAC|nr:hypothetical protein CDAR_525481 [Caerostris darwini]
MYLHGLRAAWVASSFADDRICSECRLVKRGKQVSPLSTLEVPPPSPAQPFLQAWSALSLPRLALLEKDPTFHDSISSRKRPRINDSVWFQRIKQGQFIYGVSLNSNGAK